MTEDETYERLAAPFDQTFTDVRGGVSLVYITGEQVASRLNEVLGPACWAFRVLQHGINETADEVWALGELSAWLIPERGGLATDTGSNIAREVVRQQFGSQKVKRSRSTGMPLDIGFDLKGATTDAMKKCASLIGVGLYLSHKEAPVQQRRAAPPQSSDRPQRTLVPHVCFVCGDTNLGGGGMRQGRDYCRAHWNDTP